MEVAEAIRHAIRSATFLSRPYGFNEPALNLHGVITGVARRVLDPLARHAGRPRSSSRRTSSCARPTPRSTGPRSTARTAASAASLEDARVPGRMLS